MSDTESSAAFSKIYHNKSGHFDINTRFMSEIWDHVTTLLACFPVFSGTDHGQFSIFYIPNSEFKMYIHSIQTPEMLGIFGMFSPNRVIGVSTSHVANRVALAVREP